MTESIAMAMICSIAAVAALASLAFLCGRRVMRLSVDCGILRSDISKLKREKEELMEQIRAASRMLEAVSEKETEKG